MWSAFEMKIGDLAESVEAGLHGVAAERAVDVQVHKTRREEAAAKIHAVAF